MINILQIESSFGYPKFHYHFCIETNEQVSFFLFSQNRTITTSCAIWNKSDYRVLTK